MSAPRTIDEEGDETCSHVVSEPRLRTLSNQTTAVYMQCVHCGEPTSVALKKSGYDLTKLAPFDEQLRETYRQAERARYQVKRAKQDEEWDAESPARKAAYAAYLQSPEWRAKRLQVLERDKWLCQGCLKARATCVHHLTYDHRGCELLWELVSACDPCHELAHKGKPL